MIDQSLQKIVESLGARSSTPGGGAAAAMAAAMGTALLTLLMVQDVLRATNEVVSCVGKAIASDLGSAAELLRAGAEAAYMNVRINVAELKDRGLAETTMSRVEAVRAEVLETAAAFRRFVETRI